MTQTTGVQQPALKARHAAIHCKPRFFQSNQAARVAAITCGLCVPDRELRPTCIATPPAVRHRRLQQ